MIYDCYLNFLVCWIPPSTTILYTKELEGEVQARENLASESESRVRGTPEVEALRERYGESEVRPTYETEQRDASNTEQASDLLTTYSESDLQQRADAQRKAQKTEKIFKLL